MRKDYVVYQVRRCSLLAALSVLATIGTLSSASAEDATDSIEGKFLTNVRQVTSDFAKAGEGYFSPDGRSIVFQAEPFDYPFYQIYKLDLTADAKAERISTGRGRTTCSYFSPDGKRILYASSHFDPELENTEAAELRQRAEDKASGRRRRYSWVFDQHMDIYEADVSGENRRRLTDVIGYDAECAYSPDGSQVVFCSTRDGDPDLYILDLDRNETRQLTDEPGYDGGPFFSPDGKWILYRSDRGREEGQLQIYATSVDGAHTVQFTNNVGVNWAPYWHPTESCIIWCGADHSRPGRPNYDLWIMEYGTEEGLLVPGRMTRITDNAAADVLPVFSPDGKRLMWTSTRTKNRTSQLFLADFNLPNSER